MSYYLDSASQWLNHELFTVGSTSVSISTLIAIALILLLSLLVLALSAWRVG